MNLAVSPRGCGTQAIVQGNDFDRKERNACTAHVSRGEVAEDGTARVQQSDSSIWSLWNYADFENITTSACPGGTALGKKDCEQFGAEDGGGVKDTQVQVVGAK